MAALSTASMKYGRPCVDGGSTLEVGVEKGALGATLGDPAVCAGPGGGACGCDEGVEPGLDVPGHEG